MAARNLVASKLSSRFEDGVFLDSSLETARPTSKQYSKWCMQSGHRCENWMKKVTRAEASLRRTRAPLPSLKDRTNHPMRLCRSCFASSSDNEELDLRTCCQYFKRKKAEADQTHLSVLSFTMMVRAPKNLTWSDGRSSMPWANCHPAGERWSRWRTSWVRDITSGGAGWYKARINWHDRGNGLAP